ncbi:aminodeoxychorismate/anthranilate synthase component II [Alteromonas sp. ASW11-36]|uniref:anthranilate synthase n=1 Tax=Alteromonas arenosi TaxID=3055817 RepID=A0ABT7SUM2_9ALTE|nr:aminodeoxychorismate/anthranilate synthase component II [Alteromonas sp. ASW11-36]MDM7859865.1 aminodeoxychorismate/anthranilate synthase component II [Alteromonas sp. ASW11-36]
MISVFLLDNVDSFSYNLVDELRALELDVRVFRNTVPATHIIQEMQTQQQQNDVVLVLSPGPGCPSEAGCMPELLKMADGQFPVIGICLGHQAIVEHFGGDVVRASQVMHGKSSDITHNHAELFADLPQPLAVARYHSLVGANLPAELSVIAHFEEMPMAVYHPQQRMIGYQFHPESMLTAQGSQLLMQSLQFLTGANATQGAN